MSAAPTYPLAALAQRLGGAESSVARRLRLSGQRWKELAERGLTAREADRLACRAGVHPGEVWDSWWDVDVRDAS